MNRMGCHFNQFEQILNKLLNQQLLVVEGVYSHLSCSTDINNKNNSLQVEKFSEIVKIAKSKCKIKYFHLLNSSGLYNISSKYLYDSVRIGLSMYGISPLN